MNDKDSLLAAFEGADAIFSNTDFWTQFYNPASREKLKPGQSINEYCYDLEVQQGKNVADAAATVGSLDRFILSSLCDATKLSKGKYTNVYHFDAKASIVAYVRSQHPDIAAKMSIVQVGAYMSNWKQIGKPAKVHPPHPFPRNMIPNITQQADGTYRFSNVGSGKTPVPHIDTERDTGYVVRATLQSPPGKTVLGAGSMLSWTDYLKVWCEVNKVPFGGYDELPLQTFEKYMPVPDLGREMGEMFLFFDECGYTGGEEGVVNAQEVSPRRGEEKS